MNDDYVITLEDMPGWASYEPPTPIITKHATAINLNTIDFSKAQVYDISGKRIFASGFSELKNGVYIVKIGGVSKKFAVNNR
jgi:hypothetical protein